MQQQMTTNVKASYDEIITEPSKADYIPVNIPKSKNIGTLTEKNGKKIKDVRKKLKQNKNEEEIEKKIKKKLKNIEVTQQQMTSNVKAAGAEMIDDSNEEDYINTPIFIQESENFATLFEKNVNEIKDVRKKLKQNKNGEKEEKKIKKKFKNIEVTQQQMTTNGKAAGAEIDDSSVDDHVHNLISIQEPKNVATLSKKNVKELKDVRKKLKQNKNEEEMKNKNKKKLKNIEVTRQQMTTNVKAAGAKMINDSSKENYINWSIFIQEPENVATLSEKNVKKSKDVRKKLKQNKNEEGIEKKIKKKLKNIEVTHEQMTTNGKAAGAEMIDDSSKDKYMHKSIFIQEPENFVTLSEKNVKEVKDVRKKLKQNKNGEKKEKKIKKKFKNIEVTQQQMTTNGKAAGAEMIDDSSEEDCMHMSIFIQEPENVATLSEKNVKEIKDVRKKLKQNKNVEKIEKKNKKKLKNIEVTQQQMTTNGKAAGTEMIDDSSKEDYMNTPIFTQESENVATLSEKNVKEIKDVRKKLEQNRNEEKEEKIDKNKLKNIGATQQQMTATVTVSHNEIITESNKADCICVPVYIPQSENFATLLEKNDKIIKYVPEKFEQSPEQVDKDSLTELLTDSEEKMNKMLNNETKAMKLLEDIETNDESIIIRRQIRGEDKVTDAKTENERDDTIFTKEIIFPLPCYESLRSNTTEDQKIIKNITDKAYQPPDDYHSLEDAYKEFIDACTPQQRDKNQLGVSDANTHICNRIKCTYRNLAEDILKLKYYGMNDDVNNNCQTTVNNKNKEHGYTVNETVEEDQVIKVVEENEIKEFENTDPGTTSNETLLYGKDVILENNGKMTNGTLMVEDISNVAHKIDKQIDVRKNWWTMYEENLFSRLLFLFLLLLLFLLFRDCE